MKIIIIALIGVLILSIEHKLRLRSKYQKFSEKFTKYYIDFIAVMVVLGVIFGVLYLLTLASLPYIIIEFVAIFAVMYSLFVILPIEYIDKLMSDIYND